jgi:hypothetical protein
MGSQLTFVTCYQIAHIENKSSLIGNSKKMKFEPWKGWKDLVLKV